MGMLGTTYGLKCELLYKMWVLVSPDLAARDFLAAVGLKPLSENKSLDPLSTRGSDTAREFEN